MAKRILKRHIILIAIICLYFLITHLADVTCPIKAIIKVDCPTCGITRAMLSLLRLDFAAYLSYQPLALPLCICVYLMLFADLYGGKKVINIVGVSVAVINFIYYILKLVL